ITIQNHENLYRTGQEALADVSSLVINLEKVTFLDSTAVGSLVALTKDARSKQGEVLLANVPENIKRTLEVLKLASFFVLVPSVEAAFATLREERGTVVGTTAVAPTLPSPAAKPAPEASPAQWTIVKI